MYRKSKGHIGLSLVAAVALVLTACSATPTDTGPESSVGFAQCLDKPNDCNNGAAKKGGTITYALGKDVKAWNTLSSAGNTLEYSHALFGVIPRVHVYHPDLSVQLNKDLMESATITNKSPMTVVYKIRKEASWNDGTPISADDFIYNWKVQNGKDCPKCTPASTSGHDQVTSVTGSDGGKTVTVEFKAPFPDWQAMFSPLYPAHVAPSKELETSFKWLETNIPTYSGGPYKIEKYEANFALTLVPNEKYFGTKASLDKVIYRIITKDSELVPALRNVEINAMAPIPTADLITQTKQLESQVHWYLGKALTWEHIDLNLKNPVLAEKPLREAIFAAINRQEIIDKTVGQYAPGTKPVGNHNFVPGHPAYKDLVATSGQGNGNIEGAKKILTDAGYKIEGGKLIDKAGKAVPPLRMRHTVGNTLRANSCELVQAALKNLGIEVQIVPTDNLGTTLSTGDFDLIIFAWVNSPLRIGGAKQLWFSTSSSNYGKWVNAESDKLLEESNKLVGEDAKAFDLINQANALMVKDAYVLPLFQRETFLAVDKKFTNLRPNPTNHGSPYNVGTWGLLNQAN